MAMRKKKAAAKAVKGARTRTKARKPRAKPIPVIFATTTTKRIRFRMPSGGWSMSYANRGAARRGARRVYKARITTRAAA